MVSFCIQRAKGTRVRFLICMHKLGQIKMTLNLNRLWSWQLKTLQNLWHHSLKGQNHHGVHGLDEWMETSEQNCNHSSVFFWLNTQITFYLLYKPHSHIYTPLLTVCLCVPVEQGIKLPPLLRCSSLSTEAHAVSKGWFGFLWGASDVTYISGWHFLLAFTLVLVHYGLVVVCPGVSYVVPANWNKSEKHVFPSSFPPFFVLSAFSFQESAGICESSCWCCNYYSLYQDSDCYSLTNQQCCTEQSH